MEDHIQHHQPAVVAHGDDDGGTSTRKETPFMRKGREFCEKFLAMRSTELLVREVLLRKEYLSLVPVTKNGEERH
jgi:hypothetical protein